MNLLRRLTRISALLVLSLPIAALPSAARAEAEVGKPAPDFELKDVKGKTHRLHDYAGKIVVLEWLNFDCPFVKKHYESGNMQKLQAQAKKDGVAWLSIASSAKGKHGYYEPKELEAHRAKEGGNQAAILVDADGKVGKAYGAKATPHMFVIDPSGAVAYRGAIDSIDTAEPEDIPQAKNYVSAAIADIQAGRKVVTSDTKAYGCGVKYAN